MMNLFATTYPKNTKNISFDEQSVELFYKIFPVNFGSILEGIWIFEVDAFKSMKIQEIWSCHRILSNIDRIPKCNVIFNDQLFCNHLSKKYKKYTIRWTISSTLWQNLCHKFWKRTQRDLNFWNRCIFHELYSFHRNLSNLMKFQVRNVIFDGETFCNHLSKN